jgi:hypothetical protein
MMTKKNTKNVRIAVQPTQRKEGSNTVFKPEAVMIAEKDSGTK